MARRITCPACLGRARVHMCPVKKRSEYVPYSKTRTINGEPQLDYSKRTYSPCAPNCVCHGYEVVPNTGGMGSILCDLCRGKRNISWI